MIKSQQSLSDQFVTFTLADEQYAVDVFCVNEVIDPPTITKVPNMPDYIPGVINLRGNVTPVVDLRYKLGLGQSEQTHDTRIVIVRIVLDGQETAVGIIADKVSEVISIPADEIQPPPELGTRIRSEFLHGIGQPREDHFLLILDIEKVLAVEEMIHVIEQSTEHEPKSSSDMGETAESDTFIDDNSDENTQQE